MPGNAAAIQADKPFGGLAKFGSNFLSKFNVSETPCALLESLILVDTPGVLSGDKQRLGRSYDFPKTCSWFAEHSDLILIFFDAHKLDISDELKDVINVLRPYDDKIRIVLNKASQVGRQELMRVYGALMWSLGKVIQTPEVMRVFICSFAGGHAASEAFCEGAEGDGLLVEEEADLLLELKNLPMNSATRKVNDLIKRARLARVHAIIISSLRTQMPSLFGRASKQARLIECMAEEFVRIQQEHRISPGDFPDRALFGSVLQTMDLCAFPKLPAKMMCAIDEALSTDIPQAMRRYPGAFSDVVRKGAANPFDSRIVAPGGAVEDHPDLWHYRNIDHDRHGRTFASLDPFKGKLSGARCQAFFLQSGLSDEQLARAWGLADIDRDGALCEREFSIMMHLVSLCLSGSALPETLPPTMRPTVAI